MSSILPDGSDSKSEPPAGAIELRCPYCGDEITPDLQYTTMAYSEHRDHVGYDCDNWECDARWDNRGRVERVSKRVSS